jgi:hypothetical protein
MPCDYRIYPPYWKERRERILERAGGRCEWEDQAGRCTARNHQPSPRTGKTVILTVAHLDHDPENWDVTDDRLKALCQRHHLNYDRHDKRGQGKLNFQEVQA